MMDSTDSPFGERPAGARSRARTVAIYGTVLIAAIVLAVLFTRRGAGERPDSAADPHAGMVMGPTTDSAQPVGLTAAQAQRIGVTYAEVTAGPLSREIRTVGQVTYDETRVQTVALKIDGWVERLYINYTGQPVGQGAPLLELYSPMVVAAQEELLLAHRLQRDVAGGTPDAVRSAAELLSSSRRRLRYWDVPDSTIAAIERRGTVQRTLTIASPAGGFVVEKAVLAGQKVMAGEPIYRIADLSVVWVEGEVFEQDLAGIRAGQAVTADVEAFPGEQWRGRIAYVYPTLSAETRTARIRVELPNPALRLKPGMYASLRIRGASSGSVLSVPRSAVLATGERHLVFVKRRDGMLEPRPVAIGMATADRIQVRDGLAMGDTVVASATFLVDAESNLGSALGGMGNMPGMDMTAPAGATKDAPAAKSSSPKSPRT